eukprot:TRINITY_DN48104_c0_g1_i1.p1 TRINITY_DN48104_c0_g1~~TRINITY_DN48104_c0_g1_i1.p1  ORF type:complete len:146 (-),score=22.26 TRINITY_DN48104_c0_g1_i1:112-549(-)
MADHQAGKNISHQMTIWKQLIETELKTAADWESNWGFLKNGPVVAKVPEATLSRKGHSASTPSLSGTGKAVMDSTFSRQGGSSAGRSDGFANRYEALTGRSTKTPKQRYGRQISTSHEIGWRPTIELFGVSHHGVKRDPTIWPDV